MSSVPGAALPAWRVEAFERLPSTQSFVQQRVMAGEDVHGLVVRAAVQESGRGRHGKSWESQLGGSYQSLALEDRWNGALRRPSLTLLLAVHLAEELRAAGAKATVKWPNDVYLGTGKLAGVLCTHVRGHLIVGVGMNVENPSASDASRLAGWDLEFVNDLVLAAARGALGAVVAAAVEAAGERVPGGEAPQGRTHSPSELPPLISTLAPPQSGSHGDLGLVERFAELDHLAGCSVVVSTPRGNLSGVASGVSEDGALLLSPETTKNGLSGGAGSGPDASVGEEPAVSVASGTVLEWSCPPA